MSNFDSAADSLPSTPWNRIPNRFALRQAHGKKKARFLLKKPTLSFRFNNNMTNFDFKDKYNFVSLSIRFYSVINKKPFLWRFVICKTKSSGQIHYLFSCSRISIQPGTPIGHQVSKFTSKPFISGPFVFKMTFVSSLFLQQWFKLAKTDFTFFY